MKKVSVVILNWNGRGLLEQFLPAVIHYSPPEYAEVIVADNGSTDGSLSMLEEKFPQVGLIRLADNYGFAEGYNRALEQIDSEYTVLLNSDVEVTPGWLDELVKVMDADATIACVQPKIRSYRNKAYFEYAGAAGGYIDRYGYPFCRGRLLHVVEEDKGQYDTPAEVLWTTGACLLIRTSVYKQEGGLDARFFAHQEEVEMCWRLRCRGYKLMCIPQSVVYHVGGATLSTENP
ncbi:MAG: glycosyltransferase family 2 protein, partial [Tannerellaceae bacterium]|nr:glycosyltransferase family 2 protein [Tannerellaceae bacterium]